MKINQIDFLVENIGKRQEESKRRIRWVYSVDGQSHEVEFTWSVNSGKQEVLLDGVSVLFTRKKGSSVFNETLTKLGEVPHLQLVCARTKPLHAPASFRCYELLINDKPFHTYPCAGGGGMDDTYNDDMQYNDYHGPMSILDILFPGKYGTEPTQQYDLKEDRDEMSFPVEGGAGYDQQPYEQPVTQEKQPPPPPPPPQKDLLNFGEETNAMVVSEQANGGYAGSDLIGMPPPLAASNGTPPQQVINNALVPLEQQSSPYANDLLGMSSAQPQPQQGAMVPSQQQSNPYVNDLLL